MTGAGALPGVGTSVAAAATTGAAATTTAAATTAAATTATTALTTVVTTPIDQHRVLVRAHCTFGALVPCIGVGVCVSVRLRHEAAIPPPPLPTSTALLSSWQDLLDYWHSTLDAHREAFVSEADKGALQAVSSLGPSAVPILGPGCPTCALHVPSPCVCCLPCVLCQS